jgi:hypothetical protein
MEEHEMRIPPIFRVVTLLAAIITVVTCCDAVRARDRRAAARRLIFSLEGEDSAFSGSLLFEPFKWIAFEFPHEINEMLGLYDPQDDELWYWIEKSAKHRAIERNLGFR